MSPEQRELEKILKLHAKWRRGDAAGARAYLAGADLAGANLDGAHLDGAHLDGANLDGAKRAEGVTYKRAPTQILGSRHVVLNHSPGRIQIGCRVHTVGMWRAQFRDIGEAEGYTERQIEEYGRYIEVVAAADDEVWEVQS